MQHAALHARRNHGVGVDIKHVGRGPAGVTLGEGKNVPGLDEERGLEKVWGDTYSGVVVAMAEGAAVVRRESIDM